VSEAGLLGLSPLRQTGTNHSRRNTMQVTTDYIHHAARLARQIHMDAAMGGTPTPDADFYKTLAKALNDIAESLEAVAKRRD
jgi:hypothetical protein